MRSWPLLLALALGACSLAPRYEQPVPPVAETFPSYSVTPDGAVKAPQLSWRDFFNDARLEVVIAKALANNRDLAVSVAQVEQARAQYRIARSAQLPNVVLEGTGARARQPGDVTVSITCVVGMADLLAPGLPGSVTVEASFTSPVDAYRER